METWMLMAVVFWGLFGLGFVFSVLKDWHQRIEERHEWRREEHAKKLRS